MRKGNRAELESSSRYSRPRVIRRQRVERQFGVEMLLYAREHVHCFYCQASSVRRIIRAAKDLTCNALYWNYIIRVFSTERQIVS